MAVMDEAQYVTFQQDNVLSKKMDDILRSAPWVRPLVPFRRTPTNIIIQGVRDGTPLGAFWKTMEMMPGEGMNPWRAWQQVWQESIENRTKDPGAWYRTQGQIAFGTVAMGAIYMGVMNNQITGGGPSRHLQSDPNEFDRQRSWEAKEAAMGNTKYTVRTPMGL